MPFFCWVSLRSTQPTNYLPENDRVRYTVSPDARKEVLKRLLKLNHKILEQEVKAGARVQEYVLNL